MPCERMGWFSVTQHEVAAGDGEQHRRPPTQACAGQAKQSSGLGHNWPLTSFSRGIIKRPALCSGEQTEGQNQQCSTVENFFSRHPWLPFPFRVQRLVIRVRSSRHYISGDVGEAAYPRQNQPKPPVANHHEHEERLLKRIMVGRRLRIRVQDQEPVIRVHARVFLVMQHQLLHIHIKRQNYSIRPGRGTQILTPS